MISIDTAKKTGNLHNFWNNFHFHPTDAIEDDWGKRILDEAAKDGVAGTVRFYAMLEDIVTADAAGNLHYDFTLNDARIDYMLSKGYGILLSYNFMPPCIASDPGSSSSVSKNKTRYKGKMIVVPPPKDYSLWEDVCYEYTKHIVERYGLETVSKWYLQCFNEPDNPQFFIKEINNKSDENHRLRALEYLKLYRHFASAVKRVSPKLCAGGPALAESTTFLRVFLEGVKAAGEPLDFICVHNYGTSPRRMMSGERPLGIAGMLDNHKGYCDTIAACGFADRELIIDEWGASCQGFFNRDECPMLIYREGSEFAAYMGKMIDAFRHSPIPVSKMMICLSGQHEMTTDFSGFRNFFTLNFFKKPIYNAYVLLRKLKAETLAATGADEPLTVLATGDADGSAAVMLAYAAGHFDGGLPDRDETLVFSGMNGKKHIRVWCIDESHTNPYKLSLRLGIGEKPNADQIALLREEGQLKPLREYDTEADGTLAVNLQFTDNALLLVEIE